jgi:hypothetical protein
VGRKPAVRPPLVILEPVAALGAAVVLTLILVQPFAPSRVAEAAFPLLRPAVAEPATGEAVADRVRALGLAGTVRVASSGSHQRLLLSEVEVQDENDLVESVAPVLAEAGYERTEPVLERRTDLGGSPGGGCKSS